MATGWTCMRFGWTAYVVPFLFVFSPSLLLQGNVTDLTIDVTTAVVGVWLVSAALIGHFAGPLKPVVRTLFLVARTLLFLPQGSAGWIIWLNGAGLALGLYLLAREAGYLAKPAKH